MARFTLAMRHSFPLICGGVPIDPRVRRGPLGTHACTRYHIPKQS